MLQALLTSKFGSKKDRVVLLANEVINGKLSVDEIITYASGAKDTLKADCLEALEHASKTHPELITPSAYQLALDSLSSKAPRLKWESARLIANTVHLYHKQHTATATMLLPNTEHDGTVVRWSAALALHNLIILKTSVNKILLPAINSLIESEQKNSIKKIYIQALKSIGK